MSLATFNPAFVLNEENRATLRKNFYAITKNAADQRDMYANFAKEDMALASNEPTSARLERAATYMKTSEEMGQVADITSRWNEEAFADKSEDDMLTEMLGTASDYALRAVFNPSLAPIAKRVVDAICEATEPAGVPSLNGFYNL
tara:strand:+ start:251 stop:685 length:435 start_codon:yes stop_codon:yes gene_type:complete